MSYTGVQPGKTRKRVKEARKRRGRCQAGYGFRHHPGLQSGAAGGLEHSDIAKFVLLKAGELGFHGPSGVTHNSPTAIKLPGTAGFRCVRSK